ncbi:MAG: dGTP triphosphohydrolase [Vampirovibrionales bacterium]
MSSLPSDEAFLTPRQRQEAFEAAFLHPYAMPSSASVRHTPSPEPCPIRSRFQQDRDRILHSKAFRRLKHKTQVFISPVDDHDRTRMTHSLEVTQVSRTVARALRLNEDLTEAIALGHDLGHPPFGHAGEEALTTIFQDHGGYSHTRQSYRIATLLEPLNLTQLTLGGMLAQGYQEERMLESTPSFPLFTSLEAEVVKLCDRMAYLHHDVEDATRAGLIQEHQIPQAITDILGNSRKERLNTMVLDLIQTTAHTLQALPQQTETLGTLTYLQTHASTIVRCSPPVYDSMMALRRWMFDHVYHHPLQLENKARVERLLQHLSAYYTCHPEALPLCYSPEGEFAHLPLPQRILDYLSGMSDRFAVMTFEKTHMPHQHHPMP